MTFGAVAARWLATKQATKRPSTADLYGTELRAHVLPAFAGTPLPDIARRDVQEWVNTLAASGLVRHRPPRLPRGVQVGAERRVR